MKVMTHTNNVKGYIQFLKDNEKISPKNMEVIEKFIHEGYAEDLSDARIRKYLTDFSTFFRVVGTDFDLLEADIDDLKKVIAELQRGMNARGSPLAPNTINDIRVTIKKFYRVMQPDDRSAFIRELNDYLPLIGSKKSYNRMVYYKANMKPLFDYWRINGINVEEEKFEEFFFSDQVRDHLVDVIFNRSGKGYDQRNPVDILDVLTKFFVICLRRGLSLQLKNLDKMKPIDVMCLVLVNSIDNSKDIVDRLVEIRPTVLSSGDIAQIMYGKSPFIEKRV